jgi:hypothetical protein
MPTSILLVTLEKDGKNDVCYEHNIGPKKEHMHAFSHRIDSICVWFFFAI